MKFKANKLDRRMNGYGTWSHKIDFFWNSHRDRLMDVTTDSPSFGLQQVRCWLWENYGPGAELIVARHLELPWAWDVDNDHCRLYVNSDILVAIQLKFG